jgi:hypothetical protein
MDTEKITELAKSVQACYMPRYDMWQMDGSTLLAFVEAVIKAGETAVGASLAEDEFSDTDDWDRGYRSGMNGAMRSIKDHFGVK